MRIGLDVMGGDNAPGAILDGAFAALDQLDDADELVLFGDPLIINDALSKSGPPNAKISIVPTTEVISMDESPVEAVRSKPDASIVVLCQHAGRKAENPLDIVISAGSTGAQVTAAQMYMRRLPNVHRPGIAVAVPTFAGPVLIIDVGANIEPKPHHLAQYGVMGDVYARSIFKIAKPRVALMNVGGEEQKGTAEMKEARERMRAVDGLNYIGYVEGRDVFDGQADVVITNGVVGNVMIKLAEGLSAGIFRSLKREVVRSDPELAARLEPVIKAIYAKHDYHEYGGAPLLGVNGVCIICHGSSVARTITNAILKSRQFVESRVNEAISHRLGVMEQAVASELSR
jgi:glycerol-3-phosphate acyltransferase PlsX